MNFTTTIEIGGLATHPTKGEVDIWATFECTPGDAGDGYNPPSPPECELVEVVYDDGLETDTPVPHGYISDAQLDAMVEEVQIEAWPILQQQAVDLYDDRGDYERDLRKDDNRC